MSAAVEYHPFGSLLRKVVDNRGRTCPVVDKGIPLIATNCIVNSHLYPQFENVRYVSDEVYAQWFRGHPEPGDMIFVLKGTPGRVAWVPDPVGFCIAQDMVAIRADEAKVYPKYLFAVLRSNAMQQEIEGLHVGSLIPHFKKGDFDDLRIPCVDAELQKYIGDQYFDLSKTIDLLHRQNKTLEAMAETLFRQWFVEEAEDWAEGVLGDAVDIFDGKRIPLSKMERDKRKTGTLYPYYGAAQVMDFINDYIFDGEYILLGEDGTVRTDEGYPVLQFASGKFWVNNHAHVLRARPPYSNFFVWNYLSRKNIDEIVTGAVQPKINQGNLKSLSFPKYPEALVTEFNSVTAPMLAKIQRNKTHIAGLEILRDTLLPKLMSGEVRVAYADSSSVVSKPTARNLRAVQREGA